MTLPRLLSTGTQAERRLLRSARGDAPSSAFRQRLIVSLGIGALTTAESASALAAPSQLATRFGTLASAAHASGMVVLVKWVGIAGLALAAGMGAGFVAGAAWAKKSVPEAVGTTSRPSAITSPNHPLPAGQPSNPGPVAQGAATLPLPPPRVPVAASHARPLRDPTSRDSLGVAEEVRLIDESRAALRTGDAARCLHLLGDRQRRFPNGVLTPEAALIRIEALHFAGQHDAVMAEGQRFLVHHPSGPLASRVKAILNET